MDTAVNNFTGLVSFIGSKHIISDVYDSKKQYIAHPIMKILIILSILYMNIKDVKITILIFFIYILFIESDFDILSQTSFQVDN